MAWKASCLFAILVSSVGAQSLIFDPRMSLASDDFQLGLRLGGETKWRDIPLDFFLEIEGNPYLKTVKVQDTSHIIYQFHEHRFCAGPGMAIAFPVFDVGFWTWAAGTDFSFAYYRGTDREPPSYWTGWGETGFRFSIKSHGFVGLSGRYHPSPGVSPYRVALDAGFRFNQESD